MSLPNSQSMTAWYLYGAESAPGDLTDSSLIRPNGTVSSISVDVNEFMAGPGRFASPVFFEVIKRFFDSSLYSLPPGEYSEAQVRQMLGTSQAIITLQQWAYDDGQNDYGERTYLWNSGAFEIDDRAVFVVDASGNRSIKNFGVIPFGSENFDFTSGDLIAQLGNGYLQNLVDPSGIGRKVNIEFSGNKTLTTFSFADYQAAASNTVYPNPINLAKLLAGC